MLKFLEDQGMLDELQQVKKMQLHRKRSFVQVNCVCYQIDGTADDTSENSDSGESLDSSPKAKRTKV